MIDFEISRALSWVVEQFAANWVSLAAAAVSVLSAAAAASQKRDEMKIARIKDLIAWASEAMLALAMAWVELQRTSEWPAFSDRRADARAKLAASVDQGRLFFENHQSFRPDVLDPLVRAFDLMIAAEEQPNRYTRAHLSACMNRHRTDFWKLVQTKVDPAWVRKAVQGPHSEAGAGAWDFDQVEPKAC